MTQEELTRLKALYPRVTEGFGKWLGEEEQVAVAAVPALIAEVERLRRVERKAWLVATADTDTEKEVAIVALRSALDYDA